MIFQGLPLFWQVWFYGTLLIVLYVLFWKVNLFLHSRRWQDEQEQLRQNHPGRFCWVFLVPALNEEITIERTVRNLLELPIIHRKVVVIDDASDDQTPHILDGITHPALHVIRRDFPQAQQGKARSLNQAWRWTHQWIKEERWKPEETLICVVDADGYMDREAPDVVERYFQDPQIGGMQLQVRIYNRSHPLTWLQDLEFAVFGDLFQAGRSCWRSACLGGSGQINRLSALDSVQEGDGPWMDRLTEDQDLSMRLLIRGWQMVHSNRVQVHQQGLSRLRPLLKQRTRWAQGNLEIVGLCRQLWGAPISRWAKWELTGFVVSPLLQICVGIALAGAIGLALFDEVDPIPSSPWMACLFALLAFSGVSLGLYCRARGDSWKTPFLLIPYLMYTWILWPVLIRASLRIILKRNSWSKTEREALAPGKA